MRLFPAIDLKEGRCVRLRQGDMAQATVYADDPAAQARAFEQQGFDYLHVVDLDGAFAGKPVNAAAVEAIRAATSFPVQLGGGIRDMRTVEGWLGKGVSRVIIGTAAVRDPDFVKSAAKAFPGQVAVASMPATAGWRWRAGPRRRALPRMTSPAASRMPGLPPSSTPTSPGTAC